VLNLSAFFHLNLMYSSLEEKDRPEVITRCYGPLLDLAESGFPISLEAPGLTLEIISELNPAWLERLRVLIAAGKIEFVGSGYSQIIAPLVPAKMNQVNWDFGRRCYAGLLGVEPDIWLVNEMAWSGGLPELYLRAGVKAVVMEWNNAWKFHPEWNPEFRHHHQLVLGCEGSRLPLIWVDTLDFQKFQRMAGGEMEPSDLVDYWQRRSDEKPDQNRFATLYGSDAEVFDFRPGRYRHEGAASPEGEWARIREVFERLALVDGVTVDFLGQALAEPPSEICGVELALESTSQPVVVKKQEKYNLTRWAVTGRGDLESNTTCHRILAALQDDPEINDDHWRQLCYLWSSDFRTHITVHRFAEFRDQLQSLAAKFPDKGTAHGPTNPGRIETLEVDGQRVSLANDHLSCELDLRRGLAIRSLVFPILGPQPALGTLAHGHFDDIAFGADFYTGHVVVQHPGQSKMSDLQPCPPKTTRCFHDDGGLSISTEIVDGQMRVTKEFYLYPDAPQLKISGSLTLPARSPGEIHPLHLTVIPGLFAGEELRFETRNGGPSAEVFPLKGDEVHHGESYSTLITSKHGLGATDHEIKLGDGHKTLTISHDPTVSALMPTIRFSKVRGGDYFLRLRYSAQEVDETFVSSADPWTLHWSLNIRASLEDGDS
jgi:Glycosyl hydrolase family 57